MRVYSKLMQLSRGALRCFRRLEWYARSTGEAFPFQATLAKDLKRSERSVRRFLTELRTAGLIKITKRGPTSDSIQVLVDKNGQSFGQSFGQSLPVYPITLSREVCKKPPAKEIHRRTDYRPLTTEDVRALEAARGGRLRSDPDFCRACGFVHRNMSCAEVAC